jgi:hypothetical protein
MFGFAVKKINFVKTDFVRLILGKIDLKIKWFIFGYINIQK